MSDAQILDRGYRHYDGERRGVTHSIRSVAVQAAQRVLGLRRTARYKVVPVGAAFIAYVPAIVFVGVAVVIPEEIRDELASGTGGSDYAGYYPTILLALVLFCAFAGPEALCPDRRTGMLGLYLASPLDRDRYLAAKAASVFSVLSIVTLGPPILLLVGNTFAGVGPDGPLDWMDLLLRIVVASTAFAGFFTALTLAMASTTTRQAVAGAGIVVALLGTSAMAALLIEAGEMVDELALLDLIGLPLEVVVRIHSENSFDVDSYLADTSTGIVAAAYLAWMLVLVGFTRWRYQRMDVTR